MSDIQPGDVVVCVGPLRIGSRFFIGHFYRVAETMMGISEVDWSETMGLRFCCGTVGRNENPWVDARRFRKIRPADPEFVSMIKRVKVEV